MALSHIIWNSQGMSSQGMSNRTLLLLSASALISLLAVETVLGQSQKEKWDRAICDAKGVATCNLPQSEPAGWGLLFSQRWLFEILFDRPDAVPITNPRTLQDITGIKPNPLYLGYDIVSLSAAPYQPYKPPKNVISGMAVGGSTNTGRAGKRWQELTMKWKSSANASRPARWSPR
jgi:hypothetical protein